MNGSFSMGLERPFDGYIRLIDEHTGTEEPGQGKKTPFSRAKWIQYLTQHIQFIDQEIPNGRVEEA